MKIVLLCGSLRRNSWNKKALTEAGVFLKDSDIETVFFDLKENLLPLYDEDNHVEGFPSIVSSFRDLIAGADGLVIASPEYNHSVSGVLKNAIDWLSVSKNVLDGKRCAIFGVSSGVYGTVRGQAHLRQILASLNVSVVPQPQLLISVSHFTEAGVLAPEISSRMKTLLKKTFDI